MVIALFGQTCVGKTTIGTALSAATRSTLRSCGEVVRSEAQRLGVRVDGLADAVHHAIDATTRDWLVTQSSAIVEGRYLNYVLAACEVRLRLIHLTASDGVRQQRGQLRFGPWFRLEDLKSIDEADATFVDRIYTSHNQRPPDCVLDTSTASVEECVQEIQRRMES